MAKLFIHTGIHKTGSTSFQLFLGANKALLQKQRIFRIDPLEDKSPTYHNLAGSFITNDENQIKKYTKKLKSFTQKLKPKENDVFIISSEEFDRLEESGVQALKAMFEPYFDEIKIGIYIRPHAALVDSQYSQQLREGFINISLDAFFRSCVKHARFVRLNKIISPWVNQFGRDNVVIRSAQREVLYKQDITLDIFKNFIGVDLPKNITVVPKANEKLTPAARLSLLMLLHDSKLAKLDFPQRRKILTEYFRLAPKTHIMLRAQSSVIDYSILASSRSLFQDDYTLINNEYCNGALDYDGWYDSQIRLYDRYQKDNAAKPVVSVSLLSKAQEEFWAFVNGQIL